MTGERHQKWKVARGLAGAALHLAANGKPSGLDLAREAVGLCAEPGTFAAFCRAALALYDTTAIEEAVAWAEPHAGENDKLARLIADLRSGPLAAVALARRMEDRRPLSIVPVPGRILYVLYKSLPHASDGYSTRSHGMAQGMLDNGADLVCVTRPGFPWDFLVGKSAAVADEAIETVDGVDYRRLPFPRRSDFQPEPSEYMDYASFAYLEQAAARLVDEMRRHRPACVVAASNLSTAVPACLAAHSLGLPFAYEVRGFWEITRGSREPAFLHSVTGRQERFLEVATARAAEAVITLTGAMRDELEERGVERERISLAPNACDPERFRPSARNAILAERIGLGAEVPVIGYVGSFTQYEGLDDLTSACAALRRAGVAFRLLLVGSGTPGPDGLCEVTGRVRELAAREGLADWLIMPGRVPHDEVADWYSLIDIAPFPRKSQPVAELVSPLKPLEAMAMEKAVVASSVGGMREIVRDGQTGLVFAKGNVRALEDALRRLLEDEALRQQLGKAARAWIVEQRSWRHSAGNLLDALQPLMAGLPAACVRGDKNGAPLAGNAEVGFG
ncbi:glycosyltransferase [Aurantiacibacter xanthus]|uniref:Glycosyltransferase n=1 Tax=Aurantiacibacter xanthus TaxID=1784712 RepID=A0A3A1P248_9SPHN|nr:glycosyltransferase family 4 protein [Aurantiacibacter xanthus]RIV83510.1 glycosyltransferase [Aurantiacibacter xanthus]